MMSALTSFGLFKLKGLPPVCLLHSLHWSVPEASMVVFCHTCPKGMGFWLPDTNTRYYSVTPAEAPHLLHQGPLHPCHYRPLLLDHVPNTKLLIYTDNMNIMDIFSSLCCCPEFNNIIKDAISTRVKVDIDIWYYMSQERWMALPTLAPNISFHNFTPPFPTKNHCRENPLTQRWGNKKMNLGSSTGRQPSWPMDHLLQEWVIALGNSNITNIQLHINFLPNLHPCSQPFHSSYRRHTFLLHHIYVVPPHCQTTL